MGEVGIVIEVLWQLLIEGVQVAMLMNDAFSVRIRTRLTSSPIGESQWQGKTKQTLNLSSQYLV